MRTLVLSVLVLGCKGQSAAEAEQAGPTIPVEEVRDAGPAEDAGANVWPELAELHAERAVRVVTLPTRRDALRFTVGGPALVHDTAVVSSSQFGFAAVDWRRGQLMWTKPAGPHVAPPIARGEDFILVGDCVTPPVVPDTHSLLGCARIVTRTGGDQAYLAIHGPTGSLATFAASPGEQMLWLEGDHAVRWKRGEAAVVVDLLSGIATPASTAAPPLVVEYKTKRWAISQIDGKIIAQAKGKDSWKSRGAYGELLGSVHLPESTPMIRMANINSFNGHPELRLLDMDATGSMNGTASWTPVPGFQLLGRAISPVGDAALVVRLDRNIKRDYIAAFAASALLIYVTPLPEVLRPDPVGVAIALDEQGFAEAVVAFYDGDQLAVLPNLSAPPTAPGATAGPLENPTP